MAGHKQGQKNADDAGNAWDRFRDLSDKHIPRRRASIINYTLTIGSKRGY